ncbi:hypothetical protein PG994_002284 [Apiospora phragmitis]|uniref:Uncharacterized protein n=1 Tax=Apiospora phragmitis TaxID=2905665 RepID=A0ABR1WVW2_9PEZI
MPPGLERFPLFFNLPYDIRYKIWKEVIYVPGIHFLKFEATRTPPRRPDSDDDSDWEGGDAASFLRSRRQPRERKRDAKPLYSATLKPVYPLPAADLSYYITANKTMAMLSLSCGEAAALVKMSTNKPGNLVLDSARLISLGGSDDVICIDYPDLYSSHVLGVWSHNLNQTQLDAVRRLAIKYHPEWDENRRRCRLCGHVHGSVKPHIHHHLYEFAALFKNLERFYFVDFHTIRRSVSKDSSRLSQGTPRWPGPSSSGHGIAGGQKFLSGGRTYYELDPQDCQLNSKVFGKLDWVRSEYVAYCKERPETRHSNPEKVKFWVLGCEWDYEQLEHRQNAAHLAKSRNSRRRVYTRSHAKQADITRMMERMELNGNEGASQVLYQPASLPVRFGGFNESTYPFKFPVEPEANRSSRHGNMDEPGKRY